MLFPAAFAFATCCVKCFRQRRGGGESHISLTEFGDIPFGDSLLGSVVSSCSNEAETTTATVTKYRVLTEREKFLRNGGPQTAQRCKRPQIGTRSETFCSFVRASVSALIRCASVSIFQRSIAGSIIQYFAFGYRVFKYLVIYDILSSLDLVGWLVNPQC